MFIYQLTCRPASVDSTPDGVGRTILNPVVPPTNRFSYLGRVAYPHPLTVPQRLHYALAPITECEALNGKCFVCADLYFPEPDEYYTITVVDELFCFLTTVVGDLCTIESFPFETIESCINSGYWVEVSRLDHLVNFKRFLP